MDVRSRGRRGLVAALLVGALAAGLLWQGRARRGTTPAVASEAMESVTQKATVAAPSSMDEPVVVGREGVPDREEPEPARDTPAEPETPVPATTEAGLTVRGFVLDLDGRPYEDATLFVTEVGSLSWRSRDERSAADGSFTLTGIAPGPWRIGASAKEAIDTGFVDLDLQADLEGLELRIARGGCIGGRVVWADGEPAAAMVVQARRAYRAQSTTLDSAEFELCGLADVPHVVEARAERDGVKGVARLEEIRPGGPPLRLVLAPELLFDVEFVLRDPSGAEIAGARVSAEALDGSFDSLSGTPHLRVMRAGRWELTIEARGFSAYRGEYDFQQATTLELVLVPAAEVRGVVLDTRGQRVERAEILALGEPRASVFHSGREGRFALPVPARPVHLRATKSGHAPSEPARVLATHTAPLEGVVLELREPCRLDGHVFLPDGTPGAGLWVQVGEPYPFDSIQTGQAGAFVVEDLPPGTHAVRAFAPGASGPLHFVTLVPGQISTLELRLERDDPVRMRGRVTRAGRGLAAELGFASARGLVRTRADAAGDFELELPSPGTWTAFVLDGESLDTAARVGEQAIPDAATHALTLELDSLRPIATLDELLR